MKNEKFKHLKDYSYYDDLYDRFTIEECRRIEKNSTFEYKPETKPTKGSKKKELKVKVDFGPMFLNLEKGERYIKKAETIRGWMNRDGALDEKLENAEPPRNILCHACGSSMEVTIKQLHSNLEDDRERVLFFFECPSCGKRRGVFENGEAWKPTPIKCPKCQSRVETTHKRKGKKITITDKCPSCHYKEVDVIDLNKKEKPKKIDPNFEADRRRFCLSAEEGREYIESKERLKNFSKFLEETKGKKEISAKIKKLNIAGLRKLLIPALEKEGYIKLDFSKPLMERDIIVHCDAEDWYIVSIIAHELAHIYLNHDISKLTDIKYLEKDFLVEPPEQDVEADKQVKRWGFERELKRFQSLVENEKK